MPDSDVVDHHELLPASVSLERLLEPLKIDASRVPGGAERPGGPQTGMAGGGAEGRTR
jgi:hypothetical protein